MSTEDDDYAELLAALQASGTANAPRNSNGIRMSICDKAASAIKRLISERDEAREALRLLYREWTSIARAALSHKPAKREGE